MLYVCVFLFVIAVILIIGLIKYKSLESILVNINICNNSIEEVIASKKYLLDIIINDLNSKKLKGIYNFNNNLSTFEKESLLFDTREEIDKYLNGLGKKKANNKTIKDNLNSFDSLEEDLEGLKNYYNTYAYMYNTMYKKKPFHAFYKLLGLSEKELFDIRTLEN